MLGFVNKIKFYPSKYPMVKAGGQQVDGEGFPLGLEELAMRALVQGSNS